MTRRARSSIAANPILVGAVTVLVVTVAVFLAYNANTGLPFVPTRELSAVLANGQNLVPQNEVREGGERIGLITAMTPIELPGGRVGAKITMKLDQDVPAVPVDSTFTVRPRSALALKYLDLHRGRSAQTYGDRATVPLSQGRNPVELDELLNTFDAPTRRGGQRGLGGASDALAGRGVDLNEALSLLPGVLADLEPVARSLNRPTTQLRRLFRELGDFVRVLAPVGDRYARSFATGATTFAALVADRAAYEQSIAGTPPTLAEGTASLRVQRPYLTDLAALSDDLRATARAVRPALAPINGALAEGVPAQRASIPVARRTQDALLALSDLTANPATSTALRGLRATVATLNPQLRFLGPKITVCNAWNFFWTFNADHLSQRDVTGTSERTVSLSGDQQDNSVTSMGAVAPANGENVSNGGVPQYFHGQPFGRAVDEQGNADCEDGQRGYPQGPLAKNSPPEKRERFKRVVADPRTPGNQGPLFDRLVDGKGVGLGPARVPAGQTFTAEPQTGARLP